MDSLLCFLNDCWRIFLMNKCFYLTVFVVALSFFAVPVMAQSNAAFSGESSHETDLTQKAKPKTPQSGVFTGEASGVKKDPLQDFEPSPGAPEGTFGSSMVSICPDEAENVQNEVDANMMDVCDPPYETVPTGDWTCVPSDIKKRTSCKGGKQRIDCKRTYRCM